MRTKTGVVGILILTCALAHGAAKTTRLTYVRVSGKDRLETRVTLTPRADGGFVLHKKNRDEQFKVVCEPDGNTLRWEFASARREMKVTAVRKGKVIEVSGTLKGKAMSRTLKIDERPWYQDVGFNASGFIRSRAKARGFWMVHPKKLKAYRMKISKVGSEVITVAGKRVRTEKTKMVIDRFLLSKVWSAHHWHRSSDGLFVRYLGGGGPGSPDVSVKLVDGL